MYICMSTLLPGSTVGILPTLGSSTSCEPYSSSCFQAANRTGNKPQMASLLALPCELSLRIAKFLDLGNKIKLGATCKLLRAQLLPEVFRTIRFTTSDISATAALVAVQAHGQYVKAIDFTCQCDLEDIPTAPSLSPAACKILRGHLTPNLQRIRLKFDFGLDNVRDVVSVNFEEVEDHNITRAKELQHTWRALMKETWEAVSTNAFVRELILDELPPKWTSAYLTDAFRQFLGQLESATFNLFGFAECEDFLTGSTAGCNYFLRDLDELFFRYMTRLKHLHIRAFDPLGLGNSVYRIPLALKPKDLPLLQSLKLENCIICPELVSFIRGHTQILESLDINECSGMVGPPSYGETLTWAEFFDQVYEAKPRLTELIAGGSEAQFLQETPRDVWTGEDIEYMLQKMKADPPVVVFWYIYLADVDDVPLPPCVDQVFTVERYFKGADRRAYDRLMGLVRNNRAYQGRL